MIIWHSVWVFFYLKVFHLLELLIFVILYVKAQILEYNVGSTNIFNVSG